MEVLLLIAHGSRKEVANQEVCALASRMDKLYANEYEAVVPAFLEFAEPNIAAGVDFCANLGANKITVIPYFLSGGAHVNRDIPAQLETAGLKHPEIKIDLTPHFGALEGIENFVIKCATQN
jgi:sirohydrochlorin ferrochelatase